MPGQKHPVPRTVLTIGHSNRPLEEFIHLLQAHGVTLVADVRKMPGSRRNPQFGRDSLPESLRQVESGMPRSGTKSRCHPMRTPKRSSRRRPDSPNGGWKNASFQGYADYMLTPEFEASLQELLDRAREERVALMCAEAVPWRCHRSLIADALVVRGVAVEHILGASRTQPHCVRDWARVQGTRITYPALSCEDSTGN